MPIINLAIKVCFSEQFELGFHNMHSSSWSFLCRWYLNVQGVQLSDCDKRIFIMKASLVLFIKKVQLAPSDGLLEWFNDLIFCEGGLEVVCICEHWQYYRCSSHVSKQEITPWTNWTSKKDEKTVTMHQRLSFIDKKFENQCQKENKWLT